MRPPDVQRGDQVEIKQDLNEKGLAETYLLTL